MSKPSPRWYQKEAVDKTIEWFYSNKGNPLIVCPTGSGKTYILGYFCYYVLSNWPDQDILIISHNENIIDQDAKAVSKYVGKDQTGTFCSGLGKKQRRKVTVGTIQTLANYKDYFRGTSIILVDEAHRIPHKKTGQYRDFLNGFDCPVIGLTATHYRLGSGYLTEGDNALFTEISYSVPILELLNQGFLSELVAYNPQVEMEVEGIAKLGGDFNQKQLATKLDRIEITEAICDDLLPYKDRYKHWLVFAIDIEHCNNVAEELNKRGITAAVSHSQNSKAANTENMELFETGQIQALVSVEKLTTGYDFPSIDMIVLMRPTSSPVLHIQMLGRGLRVVYEGGYDLNSSIGRLAAIANGPKPHCCVRDYAGNIKRLGPINDVQVKTKAKSEKPGNPIVKVCPSCGLLNHGSIKYCSCGHEFEFKQKIKTKASRQEIIAKKEEKKVTDDWYNVIMVDHAVHQGTNATTLRITYTLENGKNINEFLRFDPGTRAQYFAKIWWRKNRSEVKALPKSAEEAYLRAKTSEIRIPSRIKIKKEETNPYPQVTDYDFK